MRSSRMLVLGALIACSSERREPPPRTAPPPVPAKAEPAPATGLAPAEYLRQLPPRVRKNLTLKHGARRPGERGHVQDTVADSPSATPEAPRIVIWDESTGFSLTYDGVVSQRLGMLRIDPATNAFSLTAIGPRLATERDDDCVTCHGPDSRPIWPMYPDWPGFIGSDNDEVTRDTETQRDELRWLREARSGAARANDRLAPVFAPDLDGYFAEVFAALDRDAIRAYLRARVKPSAGLATAATGDDPALRAWLGLALHETYPYRANHELTLPEASRALFHRPNSRAGMLYNRLQARRLMTRIRATPVYAAHAPLIALTVMDCGWPGTAEIRTAAYAAFANDAKALLSAAEMTPPPPSAERILYPVLLASLGLRVRDVDIRLSHRSREYDRFDRAYAIPSIARNVMDVGYIAYPNPRATINGAKLFWTSYFDGSASLDELLALAMLEELAAKDRVLAALVHPMSLTEKYRAVTSRIALDGPFFVEMDRLGRWFPLPYPEHLGGVHHREAFTKRRGAQYRAVCEHLRQTLRDR